MLATIGKRTAGAFGATVGVLVVCGLILDLIEGRTSGLILALFGWGGIVFTGLAGTPIHELGHYLMCKLFGLRVTEVALFRPVAGRVDGVLGFVHYTYHPKSLWQQLGCFFAGVAPMVLGVVAILLLLRLLTPEVFHATRERLDRSIQAGQGPLQLFGAACASFFGALVRLRGWGILRGVVCLYLVLSISTHMTLSPADLGGAAVGLLVVALLCLIFGAVTTLIGVEVAPSLKKTAVVVGAFFGVGIAFAALSLALLSVLFVIFG